MTRHLVWQQTNKACACKLFSKKWIQENLLKSVYVYFNRTLEHFIRKVLDKIRWRHSDFILSIRTNILIILDLAYNQFKAPMYIPFLQFSWYKSGYYSEPPPEFLSPVEFCLDFEGYIKCERDGCNFFFYEMFLLQNAFMFRTYNHSSSLNNA